MPKKSSSPARQAKSSGLRKETIAVRTSLKVLLIILILVGIFSFVFLRSYASTKIKIDLQRVVVDAIDSNNPTYTWYIKGTLDFKNPMDEDFYLKINTNCERYGAPASGTDPDSAFEWHFYKEEDFRLHTVSAKVLAKYGRPTQKLAETTWVIKDIKNNIVAEGKTKAPVCKPVADKVIFPISYSTWPSDNQKEPGATQVYNWIIRILDTKLVGTAKVELDSNCTNMYGSDSNYLTFTGNVVEWMNDWERGGKNLVGMVPTSEITKKEGDVPYKFTVNDKVIATGKIKGPICGSKPNADINASTLAPSTGLIERFPVTFNIKNSNGKPTMYKYLASVTYSVHDISYTQVIREPNSISTQLRLYETFFKQGKPDAGSKLALKLYTCKSVADLENLNKCVYSSHEYVISKPLAKITPSEIIPGSGYFKLPYYYSINNISKKIADYKHLIYMTYTHEGKTYVEKFPVGTDYNGRNVIQGFNFRDGLPSSDTEIVLKLLTCDINYKAENECVSSKFVYKVL